MSPQEYLVRERAAELRSEYFDGEMFAMAGAGRAHVRIKDNMTIATGRRIDEGPCQLMTSDMRVKIDVTGLYTYPDIIIICEELQYEDNVFDTLLNPGIIIEVLSDSTEKYDRGFKFTSYRQIPSLQEYVLISQNLPLVESYVRQADDKWLLTAFTNLDQTFTFGTISVQIPLAEIYRRVEFSDNAGR